MNRARRPQDAVFRQFMVFTVVGAVGTVAHYLTMITLVEVFDHRPVHAAMAGFLVGAVVNYLLNYRYTFKSNKRHRDVFHKFLFIAAIGACLNYGLMHVGVELLQLQYVISQLIATAIILVWNFAGNRLWSFAERPLRPFRNE